MSGSLTSGNIKLDMFNDMRNRYNNYVAKNKSLPDKIYTISGGNSYITLPYFDVMVGNKDRFSKAYGFEPNTIQITLVKKSFSTSTGTPTPTPVVTSDIQKKIIAGTGKSFTTFTQFYNLVKQHCVYSYYFNGQYNASNAVSMVIKDINGGASGLNCVDYTQLGVKLAKEMGYTAVPYGIRCVADGINHAIFLIKGKEFGTSGKWIDLSAAANNSYNIGNYWCSGTKTKEPSWIPYE